LLATEVLSPEANRFLTAPGWREQLAAAVAGRHPLRCGPLLTTRQPISTVADKALVFRQTAAAAVDMESAAVAAVATDARLDFIAVRAIVDTALDTVPQSVLDATPNGTRAVRPATLISSLARSPGEIPGLIRLATRYRAATRALAAVAASGALVPQAPG